MTENGWIPVTERLPETRKYRTTFLATVSCEFWRNNKTLVVEWENTTVRGKDVSRWMKMRNEIIKALVMWGVGIIFFGLMFVFARAFENPETYMRIWGTCVNCGKYIPDVTGFWEAGTCPICEECEKGADNGEF